MNDSSSILGWVTILVYAVQFYALLGFGLAVYWLSSSLRRFDPNAEKTGLGLKLLLLPGLAAFWPLFLRRQLRDEQLPEEHNAHRAAARPASPPMTHDESSEAAT